MNLIWTNQPNFKLKYCLKRGTVWHCLINVLTGTKQAREQERKRREERKTDKKLKVPLNGYKILFWLRPYSHKVSPWFLNLTWSKCSVKNTVYRLFLPMELAIPTGVLNSQQNTGWHCSWLLFETNSYNKPLVLIQGLQHYKGSDNVSNWLSCHRFLRVYC